jgi:methionine salvage enolase-phosphatase E1
MTVNLRPEVAKRLEALASAQGLSVDDYLQRLIEKEIPPATADAELAQSSGMVWENGLFVYRTGRPLPSHVVDEAIRRSRQRARLHKARTSGRPAC